MPNLRIRFHPAAASEVEAAVQWYAERSPVAARAFMAEVNTCVEWVGVGGKFNNVSELTAHTIVFFAVLGVCRCVPPLKAGRRATRY